MGTALALARLIACTRGIAAANLVSREAGKELTALARSALEFLLAAEPGLCGDALDAIIRHASADPAVSAAILRRVADVRRYADLGQSS